MSDSSQRPQPPSNEEIEARLRRAVERAFAKPVEPEEEDADPFLTLQSQMKDPEFTTSAAVDPEDEELQKRMDQLQENVRRVSGHQLPDVPDFNFSRPTIPGTPEKHKAGEYLGMGVGISVAYSLVGLTVIGWLIGKLIDMRTGGTAGQAFGTLIGAIAGLTGGIIQIIRAQNKQR